MSGPRNEIVSGIDCLQGFRSSPWDRLNRLDVALENMQRFKITEPQK